MENPQATTTPLQVAYKWVVTDLDRLPVRNDRTLAELQSKGAEQDASLQSANNTPERRQSRKAL